MANGDVPTPLEAYAALPYQFPLVETFPVLRIPVIGPAPYNTLVVVRGRGPLTQYRWAGDDLNRFDYIAGTGFKLIGFDPRVPPPFEHSTTGTINMIQTTDDSAFVCAIDDVTGFFDAQGNWAMAVKAADQWDQVFAGATANFSSWILCYEPPPSPDLPRGGRRLDWKAMASRDLLQIPSIRHSLAANGKAKAVPMSRLNHTGAVDSNCGS